MRTNITQEQVTAMIKCYFDQQSVEINFLHYGVDDNGGFSGALVDHDYEIELPEEE